MPYATAPDQVRLYYEETGQGTPILFVHEFASSATTSRLRSCSGTALCVPPPVEEHHSVWRRRDAPLDQLPDAANVVEHHVLRSVKR